MKSIKINVDTKKAYAKIKPGFGFIQTLREIQIPGGECRIVLDTT